MARGLVPDIPPHGVDAARAYGLDVVALGPPEFPLRRMALPIRQRGTASLEPLKQTRNAGRRMCLDEKMKVRADDAEFQNPCPLLPGYGGKIPGQEFGHGSVYKRLSLTRGPSNVIEETVSHSEYHTRQTPECVIILTRIVSFYDVTISDRLAESRLSAATNPRGPANHRS